MLRNRKWRRVVTILAPVLWVALVLIASTTTAQTSRSSTDVSFEDQFWKYLVGNNYKNWSPGFSESADFYKGNNPHGEYLKVYVNRTAAGNIDDLAVGSVVILENYRKDQSLKTISVMYRTSGFNPTANDWYWIEYRPDGSVVLPTANGYEKQSAIHNVSLTASPKRMVMGKAANCIQCHQSAAGDDFVFSNDQFNDQPDNQFNDQPNSQASDLFGELQDKRSDQQFEYLQEDAPGPEPDDADFVADADADAFFGSR